MCINDRTLEKLLLLIIWDISHNTEKDMNVETMIFQNTTNYKSDL
jgi:hypothetical protein